MSILGETNSRGFIRPASGLRYGSILILETARPAVLSSNPQLLAMMPLPTPEMTPAKNQRKRNGRKTRKDHYLQRPERTSSWLIEIRLYYSKVALLVKTREGGEEKKRERKVVAGPLQSMKEKKKKWIRSRASISAAYLIINLGNSPGIHRRSCRQQEAL